MKAFRVAHATRFKDDYAYWQRQDEKKCKKIDALITNTCTDPFREDEEGLRESYRLRLVGTHSRAIRDRTSGEGANVKTGEADGQEPSLSSDSARTRSEKQQEEASRRAAPDARERIPTGVGGPAISTVRINDILSTRDVS